MSASTSARFGDLPYGPRLTRLLEPLYRSLGVANRYLALPLLRAGLGPWMSTPLTGSLMILRTRGRRTGLLRETPLGYAILDGSVWCCAGFGVQTHWYRNILADPDVEVVLANGSAFAGTAEVVTEPARSPTGSATWSGAWACSANGSWGTSRPRPTRPSGRWAPGCRSSASGRRASRPVQPTRVAGSGSSRRCSDPGGSSAARRSDPEAARTGRKGSATSPGPSAA